MDLQLRSKTALEVENIGLTVAAPSLLSVSHWRDVLPSPDCSARDLGRLLSRRISEILQCNMVAELQGSLIGLAGSATVKLRVGLLQQPKLLGR